MPLLCISMYLLYNGHTRRAGDSKFNSNCHLSVSLKNTAVIEDSQNNIVSLHHTDYII